MPLLPSYRCRDLRLEGAALLLQLRKNSHPVERKEDRAAESPGNQRVFSNLSWEQEQSRFSNLLLKET